METSHYPPQEVAGATDTSPALDELRLFQFYYQMYLIRRVEETLVRLKSHGLLAGSVQTAIGQEARDVGVISALDNTRDIIFANHSAHGQFIAYTDDILGLIAEVMGKEIGISGGVGGDQHLHKFNMYTSDMQSGIVLNAVGAALAAKLKATGAISVVFLNDSRVSLSAISESFNIASLWSLPLLFILQDRSYLDQRTERFELISHTVEADDVFKVYAFASAAVAYVRTNQSPFLLNLPWQRPESAIMRGGTQPAGGGNHHSKSEDALCRIAQQLPAQTRQPIEDFVEERVQKAVAVATRAQPQMFESFRRKWAKI